MSRACPRGSTGTSRARRSAAVDGAAQRARVPPVDYVDKPSRPRATTNRGSSSSCRQGSSSGCRLTVGLKRCRDSRKQWQSQAPPAPWVRTMPSTAQSALCRCPCTPSASNRTDVTIGVRLPPRAFFAKPRPKLRLAWISVNLTKNSVCSSGGSRLRDCSVDLETFCAGATPGEGAFKGEYRRTSASFAEAARRGCRRAHGCSGMPCGRSALLLPTPNTAASPTACGRILRSAARARRRWPTLPPPPATRGRVTRTEGTA